MNKEMPANVVMLDTETTSNKKNARLVQLAFRHKGEDIEALFNPPEKITYGAMAITHITNKMVAMKPLFEFSKEKQLLEQLIEKNYVVAHNAPFDLNILKNEGVEVNKSIDTLRVSQHLLESESYSLQFLRYSLGLNEKITEKEGVISPHDAMSDVIVLDYLFEYLYEETQIRFRLKNKSETLEKMSELSIKPVLMKEFKFGKYKGRLLEDVLKENKGYLEWLFNSETSKPKEERNESLVYTLNYHLMEDVF